MHQMSVLAITAGLLLIPLIPAAVLYLVLTPRSSREASTGSAEGTIGDSPVNVLGLRLKFSVVGSTATYVVLLTITIMTYRSTLADQLSLAAMQDGQAWLVEMPVSLTSIENSELPALNGELQSVAIDLEPASKRASANSVEFWVFPINGKFPTARISMPRIGNKSEIVDLNNVDVMQRDPRSRRLKAYGQVYLQVRAPYQEGAPADVIAGGTQ